MSAARVPRIVAIAVILVALVAGAYAAKQILWSGAASTATTARTVEARIVVLINQRRIANGLRPLRVDPGLTAVALGHTQDMAAQRYFAHDSPIGRTFAARIARLHRSSVGENIAWGTGGYGTAAGIVSLWMHSAEHRRIILNASLRRVGVGIVIGPFQGQHEARIATADFSS